DAAARTALLARWAFGLCLLVFGVSHFVYAKFTASLVPPWLPPSQMVWVWATGAAQIAAGLAMLSGVLAPLAAVLLTIMYIVFGALVQAPTVIAHPASQADWTENAINLILVGAAWTLADSLWRRRRRRARVAGTEVAAAAAESG
ncbi:MAG: DoxX family membrane protein, partial [Caulobacteraceae bacterium]